MAGLLAALPVAPEDTGAHYDRDDWPHWSVGAAGCDTREAVLRDQGQNVTTGRECRITGGQWTSAYDGVVVRARSAGGKTVWEPQGLDLDHLVPLAEVARSGRIVDGRRVGPRQWTRADRERYANDRAVLVPVTASSNRAKGDQDPAKWLPELDRCGYVTRWVEIKQRYELSVNQAEHDAIAGVLATCPHT